MVERFPSKWVPKLQILHQTGVKQKLKSWSKETLAKLAHKKSKLLEELSELDKAQEDRELSQEELMVRATILVEFETMTKQEEEKWRQKSSSLAERGG